MWDRYIHSIQAAVNRKQARLTESSPFALMFGRKENAFMDYRGTESRLMTYIFVPFLDGSRNEFPMIRRGAEHSLIVFFMERIIYFFTRKWNFIFICGESEQGQ